MQIEKLKSFDSEEVVFVVIKKGEKISFPRNKVEYQATSLNIDIGKEGKKYLNNSSRLRSCFTPKEFRDLIKELEFLKIGYKII